MPNDAFLNDLANCGSAETLLATIFKYHPDLRAPVDVVAIAHGAGITKVRDLETAGLSSALTTDIAKGEAAISCGTGLSAQLRRFAIAHQLGHFLLDGQFVDRQCSNRDLAENRRDTPARKAEMHANRFAAGLLMPKPLFVASVEELGKPTVTHLPDIAAAYDVTLEAAATATPISHRRCAHFFSSRMESCDMRARRVSFPRFPSRQEIRYPHPSNPLRRRIALPGCRRRRGTGLRFRGTPARPS